MNAPGPNACDVLLAHAGSLSPQETLSILVRVNAFRPMCKNCEHLRARIGADIVDCACPEFWLRLGREAPHAELAPSLGMASTLHWRLRRCHLAPSILEFRSLRHAALNARPQRRGSESPHALIPSSSYAPTCSARYARTASTCAPESGPTSSTAHAPSASCTASQPLHRPRAHPSAFSPTCLNVQQGPFRGRHTRHSPKSP
ncbi:hypothetical protein B0H11DRAFT_316268 [Mycena galericulata]|nr:hypothetical protein B0H11DRAFT_316268 [Mycena galericulata]